ncbi:isochorismatase family protein [Nocardia farcinica]|uniref:N-carbamoylsarcosine amidase n=1 Tax=Nocardia farcinica TaxID=37329 RepID=A0A449H029_NOCFR|nr:isochorismatase family protein [Nocardia farcinica]MBF6359859.1 isochorismatase family protein [Nocardia farcinica]VFA91246.1 N-carbamoylsarcosine amidase [Nocardia farcinica]
MSNNDPDELPALYASRGFTTRVGFGERAAVLTVDLFRAFTDPASPLYLPVDPVVDSTASLLGHARARGIPVIHTVVQYSSPAEAPTLIRKNPVLGRLTAGSDFLEVEPRLKPVDSDIVITKYGASAFFNSTLQPTLTGLGIDTLIITGIATSGCVRATAVDAIQHGYRPIVPRECVGDRFDTAHQVSLAEIDAKYADVEALADVITLLETEQEPQQ